MHVDYNKFSPGRCKLQPATHIFESEDNVEDIEFHRCVQLSSFRNYFLAIFIKSPSVLANFYASYQINCGIEINVLPAIQLADASLYDEPDLSNLIYISYKYRRSKRTRPWYL